MKIPEKLTFVKGLYFTDGGSIVLIAEDPDGAHHQITLGQHRFLEVFDPNILPGRLYFNTLLVPVRSELEARVLALLQSGEILPAELPEPADGSAATGDGPVVVVGDDLKEYYAKVAEGQKETIQHLIKNVIEFVGSREYVRLAHQIDREAGEGQYPGGQKNSVLQWLRNLFNLARGNRHTKE